VDFRILGPLEVDDGRPLALGGVKQRSLLALLLLERGRTVATERLIEEIWNGRPPETARKSIQKYVSSLRDSLGIDRIRTTARGYSIQLEAGELDLGRFEALARSVAAGPPSRAASELRRALALVRGEPLADLRDEPWAQAKLNHLDELLLLVTEACHDAELGLGEHRRLVPELEALAARHPYRERPLEQLMLALYRSGRQADALAVYRRGAARLRTDLGLDPSLQLRQLEQRILAQDADLLTSRRAVVSRVKRRFRTGRKTIAIGSVVAAAVVASLWFVVASAKQHPLLKLGPSIVLLDTQEGKVIARWRYSDYRFPWVTTGNGKFWLASFTNGFTEIEPRSGEILRRLLPPFGNGTNLASPGRRSVWFTGKVGLARYDLTSNRVAARYRPFRPQHGFGLYGITRTAGSVWVASVEENEVIRIDPSTGAVEARIPIPKPWWLASGDGGLWVSSDSVGLLRIDPSNNRIVAIGHVPEPIDEVVVGAGYAWATNSRRGTAYKVDRAGHIVATFRTGAGAHEPSFSGGKLWVSNEKTGTLTGIDAATSTCTTFQFGHRLGTEAALGRYVMVAITGGSTVS
jgi:DNA-binding SARP family transcriptional activator/streptogramin lyase